MLASAKEYSANQTLGSQVSFTYNADNSTTFTYNTSTGVVKEVTNFDGLGRSISTINQNDFSAVSYSYTPSSTKDDTANKLTSFAATSSPVQNLLRDHSMEKANVVWSMSNWSQPGGTIVKDTSTAFLGNASYKITQNQTNPTRCGIAQEVTNLIPGETYTLSAYVKTQNVTRGRGMILYAVAYNGNTELQTFNGTDAVYNTSDDWQRITMTFTVPGNADKIKVYGGLAYANGTAWIDCMQLEESQVPNTYNLLENSNFARLESGQAADWTRNNFASGDGIITENGKNKVKIIGDISTDKGLYQQMPVNKPAKDVVFLASAKANGRSVPVTNRRLFAIDIGLTFTDGTREWHVLSFNPDTTGEQYTSGPVMATQANQGKTIQSVTYYIIYYQNANEAVFHDLQLSMDETGSAYTYDSKGNVVSSKENGQNNQTFTYTNANELSEATEKNNESYAYTYDSNHSHRLTSARSKQTNMGAVFGYNSYGGILKTQVGTITSSGTLDTSQPYLETSKGYNSTGNYVTSETDQRGNQTFYDVDDITGQTDSVTDPKGNTTSYAYDSLTQLLTSISRTGSAGEVNKTYTYDNANRIQTIGHNGFNYNFLYDAFGNTEEIKVGNQVLVSNEYMANNGPLQSSTYGNGYEVTFTYDEFGRLSQEVRGDDTYTYLYDARGNLSKIQKNGSVWEEYSYDIGDRLVKVHADDHSIAYHHDNMDRTTGTFYTFQGENRSTQYTYGADGRSGITTLPDGTRISRTYDNLGRESSTDLNPIPGSDPTFRTQRTFLSAGGNKTTSLIDTYANYKRVSSSNTTLSSYTYRYDANGNIQSITDEEGNTLTYTYDGLNQLVRAEDTKYNSTTTYAYDAGGNLIEERVYSGTGDDLHQMLVIPYEYNNSNWKDLLTSYDGDTITYDAIGNPLSYRGGMEFTWDGRKLTNIQRNGTSTSYEYNVNGIRERKTTGSVVTEFFLNGSTILAQKTNGNTMWFFYDSNGTRVGFTYLGQTYYYAYNAQGDVVQILDSSSNVVVEYEYGPWGEMRNITGSMANTIGQDNPFRYRGYYYDSESGLYYLNARYYDPVIHRFINPDSIIASNGDITSYNLFSYCSNNPVNFSDPTGNAEAVAGGSTAAGGGGLLGIILFLIEEVDAIAHGRPSLAQKVWEGFCNCLTGAGEMLNNALAPPKTLAQSTPDEQVQAVKSILEKDRKRKVYQLAHLEHGKVITGKSVSYAVARASLENKSPQSFMCRNYTEAAALVSGIEGNFHDNKHALINGYKLESEGRYYHFHVHGRHGSPHIWYKGPQGITAESLGDYW